jgi:signal transduction histidine kinase
MYFVEQPLAPQWNRNSAQVGARTAPSNASHEATAKTSTPHLRPRSTAPVAPVALMSPVPSVVPPAPTIQTDVDLIALLAHEMRGPLHALVNSSEMLAQTLDHGSTAHAESTQDHASPALHPAHPSAMASAIHCRSLWLQELVENLLCAATIQNGRFSLFLQEINLLDVCAEVALVVEPVITQRGQALRLRSHVAAPLVAGDRGRLGQVLMNLILNASKFSPSRTTISVVVGERDGALCVTVADRGPGVPEDGAAQLFLPFARGANAAGRSEGVGLGLALVKTIVEAHGGTVGVARRPAGGSRFWITVPTTAAYNIVRPC